MEDLYRKTPRNPLILKQYISDLLKNEHILEARYYHNKLIQECPDDIETNRLGYFIHIKCLNKNVRKFEEKLYENNASREIIYSLQLFYYYTFNDDVNLSKCLHGILDIEPTRQFTYEIVIESTLILKNYELTRKLIKNYFSLNKIKFKNNLIPNEIKHILFTRLIEILQQIKK